MAMESDIWRANFECAVVFESIRVKQLLLMSKPPTDHHLSALYRAIDQLIHLSLQEILFRSELI